MQNFSSIRAVILDWAGTTVDHGSIAPATAFSEIFRRRGIEIIMDEARGPMGKSKREHIASIANVPRVAALWHDRYGQKPSDSDIQSMYDEFIPLQKTLLATHSNVIPGVPDAVQKLRDRGIKIGSTTGYSRELMEIVIPIAASQGFAPDFVICSDDVPTGRPAPWMNFTAAQMLGVYPMHSILVVDDTPIGIEAGINAGAVTIAVSRTGNALGFSLEDLKKLSAVELHSRLASIKQQFLDSGAHHVVESVADLPEVFG